MRIGRGMSGGRVTEREKLKEERDATGRKGDE